MSSASVRSGDEAPLLAATQDSGASSINAASSSSSFLGHVSRRTWFIGAAAVLLVLLAGTIAYVSVQMSHIKHHGAGGGSPAPAPAPTPFTEAQFRSFFQAAVDPASISANMKAYSSKAHMAGSSFDAETANMTKQRLDAMGIFDSVTIQEVPTVLPKYKESRYVLLWADAVNNISEFNATLVEPPVEGDPTSYLPAPPIWGGWSAPGTATGELLYANYGREEDYEALDALLGTSDYAGAVVIARYGQVFRGDILHMAFLRNASAMLVYSDPSDFGFERGDQYPNGPWGTNYTAQRGSYWRGNGDPLTPNWASESVPLSPRMPLAAAFDPATSYDNAPLPTIIVQPLSSHDAEPLLKSIRGTAIPANLLPSWKAGFNMSYVGRGPGKVTVHVEDTVEEGKIWNVVAILKGAIEPDRLVVIGSHRDAWTFGAGDPISGHSTLLETASALTSIYKQYNWRPRRSLVICSWDAEEEGLIGSVEFVEKNFRSLQKGAIAYINLDIAVNGWDEFSVSGSPSFQPILEQATSEVEVSIAGRPKVSMMSLWFNQSMSMLGTGSDYTAWFQYAGIPSLHTQLDPAGDHPEVDYDCMYHSNYDSFTWFEKFGDPGFVMHQAICRVHGLTVMSLLDDEILQYDYDSYAVFLNEAVEGLKQSAATVPLLQNMSWSRLDRALNLFATASAAANADKANAAIGTSEANVILRRDLNDRLAKAEQAFLVEYQPQQVTQSIWYAHSVAAPNKNDAYGGTALPGVSNAIAVAAGMTNAADAEYTVQFAAGRVAQYIERAARVLDNSFPKGN